MKLFKLTDGRGCTKNNTQWGEGVKHSVPADLAFLRPQLCSDTVIHAYRFLELGLLLNPLHAGLSPVSLRVWKAEGDVVVEDWSKVGCRELTTIKELPVPEWYANSSLRHYVIDHLCERGRAYLDTTTGRRLFERGFYSESDARILRLLHEVGGLPADQLQHYAEIAVAEVMRERHLY